MLQRIKYEALDFGNYEKLRNLFLKSDQNPEELTEIDLSRQMAKILPPVGAFELLPKLQVLVLSDNRIQRFDSKIITKYAIYLEIIDLQNNLIDELVDLIDLGTLENLKILEFQGNPICSSVKRIVIIQELLYPKKYQQYDPVKILTATNNVEPNLKFTEHELQELEKNIIINSKLPDEIEIDINCKMVSKYNHKNTIGKWSVQACPVPRKSRFKNLLRLNGQIITKFDVMRVSHKKNFDQIIENPKKAVFEKQQSIQHYVDPELNQFYLKKYKKRIDRTYREDFKPKSKQELIAQEDEVYGDLAKRKASQIPAKKYEANIWEIPEDIKLKNSTFNISIKAYKQMLRDHDNDKILKERKKQLILKQGFIVPDEDIGSFESDIEVRKLFKDKKKKVKPHLNLEENEQFQYNSSNSEISENISHNMYENDKSFEKSREQNFLESEKEHQSLDDLDQLLLLSPQKSPEESFLVINRPRKQTDKSNNDLNKSQHNHSHYKDQQYATEKDGTHSQQQQQLQQVLTHQQTTQHQQLDYNELRKKLEQQIGQTNKEITPFQSVRKPLKDEKNINKQKLKSLDQNEQQSMKKQKNQQQQLDSEVKDKKLYSKEQSFDDLQKNQQQIQKLKYTSAITTAFESHKISQHNSPLKSQNQSIVDQKFQNKIEKHEDCIVEGQKDQYKPIEQNNSFQTLKVKGFDFRVKKNVNQFYKSQQIIKLKQQHLSSNKLQNKIFSNHESKNISKVDNLNQLQKSLSFVHKKSKKSLQEIKFLREEQVVKGTKEVQFRPKTSSQPSKPHDEQKNKLQKVYEQAKLQYKTNVTRIEFKGDLNDEQYPKAEINIFDILPTKEQGMAENLRRDILFDFQGEEYQKLKQFKKSMEETINLRNKMIELNNKIEISSVKRHPAQEGRGVISFNKMFDYLKSDKNFKVQDSYDPALRIIHKNTDRNKLSTFDLRDIFYRANELNKEPVITEKEVRDTLNAKNITVEQFLQTFAYLETIEDIKLKQYKVTYQHIERLEKKEIERAQANAQLAYHYSRLKKYMTPEENERISRAFLGSKNQEKNSLFKIKKKTKDNRLLQPKNRTEINDLKALQALHDKISPEKKGFFSELERIKQLKSENQKPYTQTPEIHLHGPIVESVPDINEQINKKRFQHIDLPSFEELLEQSLRKNQSEYQKHNKGQESMSVEEKMMKYAQEYKKNQDERQQLKEKIDFQLQNNRKKLDEFFEWDKQETDKRMDKNQCFFDYVKKRLREN